MPSKLQNKLLKAVKRGNLYDRVKKEARVFFWFTGEREYKQAVYANGKYRALAEPGEVIYVPVALVQQRFSPKVKNIYSWKYGFDFQYINSGDARKRVLGMILGGNWDLDAESFEKAHDYVAFNERFIEGKAWEETLFYRSFKRLKEANEKLARYRDFAEFKQKQLSKWDQLYEAIKRDGYKSQAELNGNSTDEIQVCVTRSGKLYFRDGKHRFYLAKILEIKEIPVIVNVWHRCFIENLIKCTKADVVTPGMAIKHLEKANFNPRV